MFGVRPWLHPHRASDIVCVLPCARGQGGEDQASAAVEVGGGSTAQMTLSLGKVGIRPFLAHPAFSRSPGLPLSPHPGPFICLSAQRKGQLAHGSHVPVSITLKPFPFPL